VDLQYIRSSGSLEFKIPILLAKYGFKANSIMVRVNSNWGNVGFTCINRLRFHWEDVLGIMEALEEDPFKKWA